MTSSVVTFTNVLSLRKVASTSCWTTIKDPLYHRNNLLITKCQRPSFFLNSPFQKASASTTAWTTTIPVSSNYHLKSEFQNGWKGTRNLISCNKKLTRSLSMVSITKTSKSSPSTIIGQSESSVKTEKQAIQESLQDNNSIRVTPSAINQILHLAQKKQPANPDSIYLRVYVDAGGCSGFQYKFELENIDDPETGIDTNEDVVINASIKESNSSSDQEKNLVNHDVVSSKVVIDEVSLNYIKGSTVDYVREMIRSSFAIVGNPQSESACGCGSSFAVKNFDSNPALD